MGAVTYKITIEPEDIDSAGEFDGEEAEELIAEIYRRLESDLWAWCYVIVTTSIEGCPLVGRATLGGCSYFGGEKEFTQPGGYYEDLCREAREDLLAQIRAVKAIEI
jgi:hypothetical protein